MPFHIVQPLLNDPFFDPDLNVFQKAASISDRPFEQAQLNSLLSFSNPSLTQLDTPNYGPVKDTNVCCTGQLGRKFWQGLS